MTETVSRNELDAAVEQAKSAETCDSMLKFCSVVVEKQKVAIDAQAVVIVKQDEVISNEQEIVKNENGAKKVWTIISIGEALLLLVVLF